MLLTLHCTVFHLFLNNRCYLQKKIYTKTFPNWTFEKCIKSSVFVNFWYRSQMTFTSSQQWKHEFLKYCKYAWKLMYKICSKPSIKAQEQLDWCCSGVLIVYFRGVGIQDLVEHLRWRFLLQFNRRKVKFLTGL